MGYFQIIRADGSSRRYSSMIKMLQNINREDIETLWKLVKAKHGNSRPEEGYERVLWGDLKVMFEPDVESEDTMWEGMISSTLSHLGSIPVPKYTLYLFFEVENVAPKSIKTWKCMFHPPEKTCVDVDWKWRCDIMTMGIRNSVEKLLALVVVVDVNPVWEVIQNGNGPVSISTDTQGQIKILPPKSAEEILARERERKARTTLLNGLSEIILAWGGRRFHNISDAKEMWDAIKTRFGGNAKNTGYKGRDQRTGKQEQPRALLTIDAGVIDWSGQLRKNTMVEDLMNRRTMLSWLATVQVQIQSQMSARDKVGLGISETENSPVNDRYAEGMHVVPPPMTGSYIPSGPDKELDDSQFTYGPKQSKPSESDARSSDFNSYCSIETHESLPKPTINEPKVVTQPKVWSDAPIIEEYESDSKDEHVTLPTEEQETPSFANQQVKTPREIVKNQFTHSKNSKVDKKGLGYGFTTKACFVCGSLSHLIRDCDFHEKRMAKQVELNKQKGKGNVQRENKPVWNNVQRVNHKNQFVPTAVLTRTGKIPVSTARASGTNNVSTARHNFNSQAVLTNAARKISTVKPFVNKVRPKTVFHKTHSPFRRPFNNTTALKTTFTKQKVNTAGVNSVSVIGQNRETVVKTSAGCNWRTKRYYWNRVSKYNSGSMTRTNVYFRDPQGRLKSAMAWVPKRN
ncbi:hypothetical protein Tco_1408778 [Tanacetum coccineum]